MVKLILLYNECTDLGLLKPTLGGFGVLQVFRFWSFDTFCPYGLPYIFLVMLIFFKVLTYTRRVFLVILIFFKVLAYTRCVCLVILILFKRLAADHLAY